MTRLEELKKQKRDLDAQIKAIENENKMIVIGNTKYEHRTYPTGREEDVIAVSQRRRVKMRQYNNWWGQMLKADTRGELVAKLRETIENLTELLEKVEEIDDRKL